MTLQLIADSVHSVFTGLGTAIGLALYEFLIKPHMQEYHDKEKQKKQEEQNKKELLQKIENEKKELENKKSVI